MVLNNKNTHGPKYGSYNVHISLEGDVELRIMFATLLVWIDPDCPIGPNGTNGIIKEWTNPLLTDSEIILLWTQLIDHLTTDCKLIKSDTTINISVFKKATGKDV